MLSKRALRTLPDTLSQEYEALRTRGLSGYNVAYLFIDTVDAPRRRGGSQTGVLGVWGSCVDGRTGLRSLVTTNRASHESCVEVVRDRIQRGLQTPVTMTTDGAPGLIKAVDSRWPRSLRMRCWFHKRQNRMQKVPPPAWPAFQALGAALRDAPTCEEGPRRFQALLAPYQSTFPEACRCLADDAVARLNH